MTAREHIVHEEGGPAVVIENEIAPANNVEEEARSRLGKMTGDATPQEIPSTNLVIMNPPFTRPTNHEGRHSEIPNPAFAAFGADAELQKDLSERSKKLRAVRFRILNSEARRRTQLSVAKRRRIGDYSAL